VRAGRRALKEKPILEEELNIVNYSHLLTILYRYISEKLITTLSN
jgi:hypothetical protein